MSDNDNTRTFPTTYPELHFLTSQFIVGGFILDELHHLILVTSLVAAPWYRKLFQALKNRNAAQLYQAVDEALNTIETTDILFGLNHIIRELKMTDFQSLIFEGDVRQQNISHLLMEVTPWYNNYIKDKDLTVPGADRVMYNNHVNAMIKEVNSIHLPINRFPILKTYFIWFAKSEVAHKVNWCNMYHLRDQRIKLRGLLKIDPTLFEDVEPEVKQFIDYLSM
jgi:hypothetical protein